MSSTLFSFFAKLVLGLLGSLFGSLLKKKEEATKETVSSQKRAIESVGDSIQEEEKIRKGQKDVEPSGVQKTDGGIDVGNWNSGK